jgi:cysteine synthase A
MIFPNILEAIGRTPLIRLNHIGREAQAEILVKLEAVNVGGSIKSRPALAMVDAAERAGHIKPGSIVIEASTGNQGIAVAMVCSVKGYRCIIVMPERMGAERRKIIRAYGGEVILTPTLEDMQKTVWGARERAMELERELPNAFYLRQFDNPANPAAHRSGTAAEILEEVDGRLDAFLSTIGSGGTLAGVAAVLKTAIPGIRVFGVEPFEAAQEATGRKGLHKQQGIGDAQLTRLLDRSLVDGWLTVTDEQAYAMTRRLAREEGILAGISSGTSVHAAVEVAGRLGKGARVLTILPDTAERYLDDELFATLV